MIFSKLFHKGYWSSSDIPSADSADVAMTDSIFEDYVHLDLISGGDTVDVSDAEMALFLWPKRTVLNAPLKSVPELRRSNTSKRPDGAVPQNGLIKTHWISDLQPTVDEDNEEMFQDKIQRSRKAHCRRKHLSGHHRSSVKSDEVNSQKL